MKPYKRDGSKYYWVRIEKNGKVVQRSSKCTGLSAAKDFAATLRTQSFGPDAPSRVTTLAEFWPELEEYWTNADISPRTLRDYQDSMRHVLAFPALADSKLHEIGQSQLRKFFPWRKAQGVSAATVNHSVRALRAALHIAAEQMEYIASVPKLFALAGENPREAVLSETDFQRLLKACAWKNQTDVHEGYAEFQTPTVSSETMRALFTLLFDGGLRAGEGCNLAWKNVAAKFVLVDGKTGERRVPLTTRTITALTALRALRPNARFCFSRFDRDKPLTVGFASHKFARLRRSLELEDGLVLHSLRHSCATRMGAAGMTMSDLMVLFGWSSPAMAARYVHTSEAHLARLAGIMEPRAGALQ